MAKTNGKISREQLDLPTTTTDTAIITEKPIQENPDPNTTYTTLQRLHQSVDSLLEEINETNRHTENLKAVRTFESTMAERDFPVIRDIDFKTEIIDTSQDLHLIPAAAMEGTMAAVIPIGSDKGDWTVSTSANATAVNRAGKIAIVGAGLPRLAFNPITHDFEALIIENSFKNNTRHSNLLTDALWTANMLTVTESAHESPADDASFFELKETAGTGQHRLSQTLTGFNFADGTHAWVIAIIKKETSEGRNAAISLSGTGLNIQVIINPVTGEIVRQDFAGNVRVEIQEFKSAWRVGVLGSLAGGSGTVTVNLHLRSGSAITDYAGDITKKLYFDAVCVCPTSDTTSQMPEHIFTASSIVTKAADIITLPNWIEKGIMGQLSGRVTTETTTSITVQEWEGDTLTVTTNGTAATPITSPKPTSYTMSTGRIRSVKIKNISDAVPEVPAGFDFNLTRGFASYNNVTGGGTGTLVQVTTPAELISALNITGARRIQIMNNMDMGGSSFYTKSNKTIFSANGIELNNCKFRIENVQNIRIRNIKFTQSPQDLIAIQGTTGVSIEHCEFNGKATLKWDDNQNPPPLGSNVLDGLVDIIDGSDFITIQFCKFLNHNKCTLIGNSDLDGPLDSGKLHVSLLYNYYENLRQRCPQSRFGTIHVANCWYFNNYKTMRYRLGARAVVEGTYFQDSDRVIDPASPNDGFWVLRNNVYDNIKTTSSYTSQPPAAGNEFEPTTFYTNVPVLSPAESKAFVTAHAGATLDLSGVF